MTEQHSRLPIPSRLLSSGHRETFIIIIQFILWWGANNWYAIDAHLLLKLPQPPHLFIVLTFAQVIVGLCMAHIFLPRSSPAASKPSLLPPITYITLAIALTHVLGVLFTNSSYHLIGSSSTLVWKLTEPLSAILFKRIILSSPTSFLSTVGILIVLAGVLIFSANSLPPLSLSPIIIANLAFPLRNVLVKYDNHKKTDQRPQQISPACTYFTLQATSIPFCLLPLFYAIFFHTQNLSRTSLFSFRLLSAVFKNALIFNIYMFSSICILQKLDPLTHSVANTLKRFTAIALSFFIIRSPLHMNHVVGLLLTLLGFPLYAFGSSLTSVPFLCRPRPNNFGSTTILLFGVLFSLIGSVLIVSHQRLVHPFIKASYSAKYPHSTNSRYLVIVPDTIYAVDDFSYQNYDDAMTFSGGNVGNRVWQYAAYRILPDFSNTLTCNQSTLACEKRHDSDNTHIETIIYRPSANAFSEMDMSQINFTAVLERMNSRNEICLFIGIGSQAGFTLDDNNALGHHHLKSELQNIEAQSYNFKFMPETRRFLLEMERRRVPMLMRGDFTRDAARKVGYTHGISLGCPSLMLNPDVHMGATLQRRYTALRKRIGDKSLKIAITNRNEPRFLELLMDILNHYPNSFVYAQGKSDLGHYKRTGVPYERIRFFTNVHDWMKSISHMDVAFGGRIHGSMMALSVSVPVFVIAPDHRVLELVKRMQVLHTTSLNKELVPGLDVAGLMTEQTFDGEAFDRNRCEIAKEYEKAFKPFGIGISQQVRKIARSC